MKEVRFSEHSLIKLNLLSTHGIPITPEFILETIQFPDKIEISGDNKRIAQKRLDGNLVIRVVYREFSAFVLIITLYPGRRTRYEKDTL
jgi:hypothetical protein